MSRGERLSLPVVPSEGGCVETGYGGGPEARESRANCKSPDKHDGDSWSPRAFAQRPGSDSLGSGGLHGSQSQMSLWRGSTQHVSMSHQHRTHAYYLRCVLVFSVLMQSISLKSRHWPERTGMTQCSSGIHGNSPTLHTQTPLRLA